MTVTATLVVASPAAKFAVVGTTTKSLPAAAVPVTVRHCTNVGPEKSPEWEMVNVIGCPRVGSGTDTTVLRLRGKAAPEGELSLVDLVHLGGRCHPRRPPSEHAVPVDVHDRQGRRNAVDCIIDSRGERCPSRSAADDVKSGNEVIPAATTAIARQVRLPARWRPGLVIVALWSAVPRVCA